MAIINLYDVRYGTWHSDSYYVHTHTINDQAQATTEKKNIYYVVKKEKEYNTDSLHIRLHIYRLKSQYWGDILYSSYLIMCHYQFQYRYSPLSSTYPPIHLPTPTLHEPHFYCFFYYGMKRITRPSLFNSSHE